VSLSQSSRKSNTFEKKHLGKNIIVPKRETGLNLITIMALKGYRAQWNCTDRQLY